MTKKIFRSSFAVAMLVLLACLVLLLGALYDYFGNMQREQLKTELSLAATGVEQDGVAYLKALQQENCRLTLVGTDGRVLFDSDGKATEMGNHADREEIAQAMKTGSGESSRYSSTLTEQTVYYAKRLSDGTVLRVSVSRATVPVLILGMLQPILIILTLALILSGVLARRLSKKIVEPFNALNLDEPLENNTYDELSPLLTHIDHQQKKIAAQRQELQRKQNEFYAVIKNMNEGLVLLNGSGMVLSINPAASSFFGASNCIGQDFLTVERSHEISRTLEEAARRGHAEMQLSREGREYQLRAGRIEESGTLSGMVLLIFDITDRVFAERNRQEFTANVSHELKTPLHSIMGSAELIENGMVKPEDLPRFVGHIRTEAERLVSLIDNILRLSQLDEGVSLPSEAIDLHALAAAELDSLSQIAANKHVLLSLKGETAEAKGVRQLLHEIVYNLCDNAIKYNVDGGSVTVTTRCEGEKVLLSVADTGIGIPPEHQQRVFERFYRVDKSHSRQTGGTGLGLSIVKHAVQYMDGSLDLKSRPGEGTTVTVCFAAAKPAPVREA